MATANPSSALVADINDRNPFGSPWDDLEREQVEAFLTSTGDDEPLTWEAKGGTVRPEHVAKAAAAFGNRVGGYLILGASRDKSSGTWQLDGVEFPGSEPRTWVSRVIRNSVSPPPAFEVHAWDLPNKKKAAVVQIQPNSGYLSITHGRVYYRRPGESSFLENGAELQAIQATVQYRSRALPGSEHPAHQGRSAPPAAPLAAQDLEIETELDPDMFLEVAQQLIEGGKAARVNIYISGATQQARSAIDVGDEQKMEAVLDRITGVAGVAISYGEATLIAQRAIKALQDIFHYGLRRRGGPTGIDGPHTWINVLSRARAIGAMAMRLEQYAIVRTLVLHEVDVEGPRLWPTWLRYGDIQISRADLYTIGTNVLESSRMP